ncbi:hypothetical protein MmonteBS_25680 [Mycobacterium montefiorense]|uniref:Uncharacterized protein n=1 Tax=Mycobacterium montefiorense TaxID=154654 RepID=A0ABQ0NN27_9MYCO|nr:hypothetical protein MmonteBS_25680 [Mycobacterium montefiorense]GKU41301.1 hypothetical protein NJB14192_32850 [Mycobacterium montefiorense]GKU64815.1 hypothetical protein NJB18182_53150 [Mycobacterium montefiorense]GKU69885.1 hypothetical protein NJB18183_50300 [Mycobacterium montefiorense]
MLVVADQYHVDAPKVLGAHRGTGELRQVVVGAGRIERGVHHDPATCDIDDCRGAAQHSDRAILSLRVYYLAHGAPDCIRRESISG